MRSVDGVIEIKQTVGFSKLNQLPQANEIWFGDKETH